MRASKRCVTVRLRIEGVWIMFMQICAPIDKDDVDKDAFFGYVRTIIKFLTWLSILATGHI